MIHFELIARFISDYRLPIQIINNEGYLEYMLDLYEPLYESRTKWNELQALISEKFNNSPGNFLATYYKVRESIISSVKEDEDYKAFNNSPISEDIIKSLSSIPQVRSNKGIYSNNFVGSLYISIDLSKANFQALHYVGVIKDKTYNSFISKFTDLDYIKNSKYLRSVVFGQLNPGRHITIEKYLTLLIYRLLEEKQVIDGQLVSFLNDELIYKVEEVKNTAHDLEALIMDSLGLDVKVEIFKLGGYGLVSSVNNVHTRFFEKRNIEKDEKTLHCVPSIYFPIVIKKMSGKDIEDYDTWILHDRILGKIIETFDLITL